MIINSQILGYPCVGEKRELKFASESYQKGKAAQVEFLTKAQAVETSKWKAQIDAGLSFVTVGDFVFL